MIFGFGFTSFIVPLYAMLISHLVIFTVFVSIIHIKFLLTP